MVPLDLPAFRFSVRKSGERAVIFDVVRRKYVTLTPEEWVRQHWIRYLSDVLGYPLALMGVETGFEVGGLKKRFDVVVCRPSGMPLVLVECKAPSVSLSSGALDQLAVYQLSLKARILILSNGVRHIFVRATPGTSCHQVASLPSWSQLMDEESTA